MTPELHALTLAGLLLVVQFTIYSVLANLQVGPKIAMGPRDITPDITGTAGRAQRALNNHYEGLIFFTLAVTVTVLADKTTHLSAICAYTYLGARILYVPAYLFGLAPWRSLIWMVGFLATLLMLILALLI